MNKYSYSVLRLGHEIKAVYNERTIRIYQAYSDVIADEAVKLGHFGASFKLDRMTWIKPSFLWMMYRCGWGGKESQNRILAIDLKREGFDTILEQAVLSTYKQEVYGTYENWKEALSKSKVRCQWDPDRDIYGNPLSYRTIQLGIKDLFAYLYVNEWIVNITDVTSMVIELREKKNQRILEYSMLPREIEYQP